MHLTHWYIVFICPQIDVCENYIGVGSIYVDGYYGLSESRLCVFGKLCPVIFLVVCKCSSVLLQSIVCCMLMVVMMGRWLNDSAC